MSIGTYDIGDVVELDGAFTADGSPVDPATIAVTIRLPDGTRVTKTFGTDIEVVRTSAGVYYMNFTATLAGTHWYRWVSTGSAQAAEETFFVVRTARTLR